MQQYYYYKTLPHFTTAVMSQVIAHTFIDFIIRYMNIYNHIKSFNLFYILLLTTQYITVLTDSTDSTVVLKLQ